MLFVQAMTSFIASSAFGVLFNVPRKALFQCGLAGMFGWLIYWGLIRYQMDIIVATLISAFVVAIISQIFSRTRKMPITVFNVSGIIPLVPGGLAFDSMRHFVQNDYNTALEMAAKVFLISGAIAIGLVLSEVINQITKTRAKRFR